MKTYLLAAVVVVAYLECHYVQGSSSLTKCQLKSILDGIYPDNSEGEDLVIKLVCKVELTSGFNTGLHTQPDPIKFDMKSDQAQPDCTGKGIDLGTLYGAFQLSNRVACTDNSVASLNLCQMPCSDLIQPHVTDDAICNELLRTIPNKRSSMFPTECASLESSTYFSEC